MSHIKETAFFIAFIFLTTQGKKVSYAEYETSE